ncbi:MAG: BON domain-containing protein [Bacteroidota bacterium]
MVSEFYQELTTKINNRLAEDQRLAAYALKAKAYEDGLVRIQGIVDVLKEREEAEKLIRRFPGVKRVENNVTVCTDGGIDDEDVAFEVSEELLANPEVPDSVGVKVSGGQVQLVGSIQNQGQALEAIETAGKARGVREVRNQLKYTEELDDVSITNQVQTALLEEAAIIPGRVKVLTEDGRVILWGNASEDEIKKAMEVAARVPGVKSVKNSFNRERVELDDQIVVKAMDMIAANPFLNEMPVNIEVEDGRIVLSGMVDTLEAKRGIDEVIHEVIMDLKPVAFKVDNQVRLVEKVAD